VFQPDTKNRPIWHHVQVILVSMQ